MILCNYLLEKRDRCHALHIFTIFASPAFSTSSEVRVLDRRVLPRDYPNLRMRQTKVDTLTICFRVAGHLQTWAQRQQGPIYGGWPLPPPPDCIVTYAYENGHIFPRSFLIFLLSFFPFYWKVKRRYDSTAKLWRELPTGAELAARPNEAEPSQQVTLTWKSFEILDFLIFLYGRKKLTSKEFARYFCLLFVLFYIFSQWSSTEHAPCPLKDTRS